MLPLLIVALIYFTRNISLSKIFSTKLRLLRKLFKSIECNENLNRSEL